MIVISLVSSAALQWQINVQNAKINYILCQIVYVKHALKISISFQKTSAYNAIHLVNSVMVQTQLIAQNVHPIKVFYTKKIIINQSV